MAGQRTIQPRLDDCRLPHCTKGKQTPIPQHEHKNSPHKGYNVNPTKKMHATNDTHTTASGSPSTPNGRARLALTDQHQEWRKPHRIQGSPVTKLVPQENSHNQQWKGPKVRKEFRYTEIAPQTGKPQRKLRDSIVRKHQK